MTDILIKIATVLALVAALFFAEQYIESLGYHRAKTEDTAAVEQQKREAANTLLRLTDQSHASERALQDFKNQQELNDAVHQKTVADLSDRLRRAAGPTGRLRDPHAVGCGAGGNSAPGESATASGDRAADPAVAGGLLSADFTGLLQRLSREADEVNNAYTSCRADAYSVRGLPP